MSEQTFFVGDNYKGNEIQRSICPCCGNNSLSYGVAEFEDDNLSYPWTCDECNSTGSEWYSLEFSGHNVKEDDHVVGKDMGEDTMENIVEVHLLAMFSSIQMDKPDNFHEMVAYICRDITECGDVNDFVYEDVVIGFRRFIQSI
jgi:hypothetical protein